MNRQSSEVLSFLAAPFEKRLGLGLCSLLSAELPYTTDALHSMLVGSWISVLNFRKPLMAVANEVFKVIPAKELNTASPRLWRLSRCAASELQVLSVLAPVIASNISLPFDSQLYATDASEAMGGIAVAEVGSEVVEALWVTAEKKGPNVPMLSSAMAVVSQHDDAFEEEDREYVGEASSGEVPRPIGFIFQFIEICGGAGKVTACLSELGVVCGPILDLSMSKHYNLAEHRVISWVAFMLEQDRLQSFLVAPPCTTFSPAAHPALRTYKRPRGLQRDHPRVLLGNMLAFAALTLLFIALRLKKLGLGEQPRRSKMRWLREWVRLLLLGATEAFLASCNFGSPHQKEFCFLGVNMQVSRLNKPCTRDHGHIPIQGAYTKPSATYTDELAMFLAVFFADHLKAHQKTVQRLSVSSSGLESIVTNDVAATFEWSPLAAWKWQHSCHINILENYATLKLFREAAKKGGDIRFCYLGDSHVSRSAIARGRSSSHALRPGLSKIASLCIAFGLYPAGRSCPTRLNPGDGPSRQTDIPPPVQESLLRGCWSSKVQAVYALETLPKLRRWISNWARLVLLQCPVVASSLLFRAEWRIHPLLPVSIHELSLDFDSTLGFPGEGPAFLSWIFFWIFFLSSQFGSLSVKVGTGASHGDLQRKTARAGVFLGDGRRVTDTTKFTRDWLYGVFESWLVEKGLDIHAVIYANPPDVDLLNKVLVDFGRWLFAEGKPYYHYSETINSISSQRPALRRSMQQA
jgi:hypothetical protein